MIDVIAGAVFTLTNTSELTKISHFIKSDQKTLVADMKIMSDPENIPACTSSKIWIASVFLQTIHDDKPRFGWWICKFSNNGYKAAYEQDFKGSDVVGTNLPEQAKHIMKYLETK